MFVVLILHIGEKGDYSGVSRLWSCCQRAEPGDTETLRHTDMETLRHVDTQTEIQEQSIHFKGKFRT